MPFVGRLGVLSMELEELPGVWALDPTPTREATGHVCTAIGYAWLAQPMVPRAFLPSV